MDIANKCDYFMYIEYEFRPPTKIEYEFRPPTKSVSHIDLVYPYNDSCRCVDYLFGIYSSGFSQLSRGFMESASGECFLIEPVHHLDLDCNYADSYEND